MSATATPRRTRSSAARPPRYPRDPATRYARDVVAGRAPAGPHVRDACARHLRDLVEGPKRGLRWDVGEVEHTIGFFRDVLRLAGGEHEGKPFILTAWQAFVVGSLFGWKRPHETDGKPVRRFRTAYVETGKGSGKSPLAAGIGIKGLVADGEARAEIYAAATKREQANVLFRDAVAMVEQSAALSNRLEFSGGKGREWNIAYLATGSFFRPIASTTNSAESGQSGPRPHMALLDEIHEHKTNTMVEFLRAGTKGRRQALIFMITNSGVDRTSVCYEYHEYGAKVCAGDLEDDSFFAYIAALDEGEDPLDPKKGEKCWAKVNPSMGVTFPITYLREQVTAARGMPAKESIVRRLNFCEWVDAANPWIAGDRWRGAVVKAEDFPSDAELKARPLYLALDLSGKLDLTSLGGVWPEEEQAPEDEGPLSFVARSWFWTPQESAAQREKKDRAPYTRWIRDGHVFGVPGLSIDYAYVANFIAELQERFNVAGLAFDPYRMDDVQRELTRIGVDSWVWDGPESRGQGIVLVRHGQGFAGGANPKALWMNRSIETLEDAVLGGTARILSNPALTWNSASAVLQQDAAGNRVWEKRKSTGRIDGIVALSMAAGLAALMRAHPVRKSVYESRGVRVIR